jgi:hypothetical protein
MLGLLRIERYPLKKELKSLEITIRIIMARNKLKSNVFGNCLSFIIKTS